ncbi:hypothetical protein LZD49_12420 [Dyadobacter sp. CY261]|uniref:hypothetical protein n=1 Tax=Dyadobacter sp. CY261 TaxID=2907203 RepID=UPI001F20CE83|nr:hypothetical protein [Dyadobacter sp. CY261]MCF0071277.1 hypothetical protein [Dyadobacter sp. CY261]
MAVSTTGPASGLDINCYRGDTFERWIRIRRNGIEENLQPSTYRMQIRNGNTLIKEIASGLNPVGGISIETMDGGVLLLQIPAGYMEQLPAGSFVYDIQQTYPNGKIKTRVRGAFTITDDITKTVS